MIGHLALHVAQTSPPEGDLGPWVLVAAIGLGLTFVLLLIGLLAGLSALSRARQRRRGVRPAGVSTPHSNLPVAHRPGPLERRRVSGAAAPATSGHNRPATASPRPASATARAAWPTRSQPPAPAVAPVVARSATVRVIPGPEVGVARSDDRAATDRRRATEERPAVEDRPVVVLADPTPAARLPRVRRPAWRLPRVRRPAWRLPRVRRPAWRLPRMRLPAWRLPTVRRPGWSLPHLHVPLLGVVKRVRRSRPASAPLARAPRVSRWRPHPRSNAHPVLLVAAVALPSILLGRTLARPDWWWDGAQVWAAVAGAVVLTGTGLRWLSHVVRRPHSLTRRGRARILADRHRREQQEEAARHLLTGLRAELEPAELWAEFSASSGLHVPPQVKPLISPAMEPGALVSYLERGHQPEAQERPIWVVVAVPLLACILPAAVLVLAV